MQGNGAAVLGGGGGGVGHPATPHPRLASDGVLAWKVQPRTSPAHTKAMSHVTDLGQF